MELSEIQRRMHTGELYCCGDPYLIEVQTQAQELLYDYNHTRPSQTALRRELLRKMMGDIGENCHIEPPFHSNWAGMHVHFGNNIYANYNLTLVDDTHIYVGDNVLFGPNVTVCTAAHPIHTELRRKKAEYNLPIHIGNNVWIGGGAFILPGVTIGENSVIGAGSVVTRDIPANVVAVGSPCRVLREIGEQDEKFYQKDRPIEMI